MQSESFWTFDLVMGNVALRDPRPQQHVLLILAIVHHLRYHTLLVLGKMSLYAW